MKWAFWIFVGLYAAAVFLLAVSTFGLFGQERDPLGGVFLLPLGLPWNLLADKLDFASPAILIAAPLVNAAILFALWKKRRGRSAA